MRSCLSILFIICLLPNSILGQDQFYANDPFAERSDSTRKILDGCFRPPPLQLYSSAGFGGSNQPGYFYSPDRTEISEIKDQAPRYFPRIGIGIQRNIRGVGYGRSSLRFGMSYSQYRHREWIVSNPDSALNKSVIRLGIVSMDFAYRWRWYIGNQIFYLENGFSLDMITEQNNLLNPMNTAYQGRVGYSYKFSPSLFLDFNVYYKKALAPYNTATNETQTEKAFRPHFYGIEAGILFPL